MVKPVLAGAVLLLATVSLAHAKIVVESVNPGSPAAAAGMKAGDGIIRIDGREISTMDDLEMVMTAHQPGDKVPLTVQREGEVVDLMLTFGERAGGGVSIGVSLNIIMDEGEDGAMSLGEPTRGTVECLAWINETYQIESMMSEFHLELSDDYETIRTCVARDTRRMTSANAIKYCDNVFKVHCFGLDLIAELAEAQVQQCEERLSLSLGLKMGRYKGWMTCAQHKIYDLYSMAGQSSDEKGCRAAFLDECGTNIDATINKGKVSLEQKEFLACCSADGLDPESSGDSDDHCPMLDDGFLRGPCHDQAVCINRLTSEWVQCSALQ